MSKTFEGSLNKYNAITVDSLKESCDPDVFSNQLSNSLKKWKEEKRRCIWFNVNIKDSRWIPLLANEGFKFHHTKDDFLMMYKWLPKDTSPNLPPGSHTNLGVGGMVFNEKGQLLVVKEKHYEISHWKLPGGYVEREEDIKDAAIREVKEETGIDTVFVSMVTFRHTHKVAFGNSDIYVVVMLKAISDNINKCEQEIMDCQWIDVDEYLNHPDVIDFNRFLVRQALDLKDRKLKLNLTKNMLQIANIRREYTSLIIDDV